ncbi:hypothetical protein [Meiothermus rufus]|uniref:hypothetical protein n=1 Tax=Meiothermus rufus TaxID=604332 RepID=UPI0003FB0AA0|nr:hypothetical protein [Meiothermus rufus]
MKRFGVPSFLVLLLAACGLISSPPIDNPFGLAGEQTTFTLGPSSAATGTASATATFEDLTNLNLPLNPTGFTYNLAIQGGTLGGTGCPSPLPSSVQVKMDVTLTVSDNPASGPRSTSATANNVEFTLSAIGGGNYSVSNLSAGSLNLNVGQVLQIIQTGGSNTAVLQATINTTSTPDLAGCTLTLTWGGGTGVLKF